jgi:EAL domain-containing protein (putative c-di-GMP-specific phosphodiesterase class I)
MGVATSTHEYRDPETLLAHADVALYRAKAEERGTFHFFTDQLHRDVRQRFHLLTELRRAIQQRELVLHYQPQVNMQTGAIVGLEALVRWLHPHAGMIPPSQFIPAAENSGLIIALGQFVLVEACRQARQWIDEGITVPAMAVNVSPTQFKWHSRLDEEVLDALRKTRISANLLELELTETALMQASRDNSSLLQAMRDRGIRIAIDDFGTGYSCLDYLRRFPASRIKIAQTFVAEITHSAGSAAITRATISLGRELGLSVIAEGVETADQVALLTKWGCHEAQGYLYAKPMPAEKIPELLRLGKIHDPDELPESSRCARSA